MMLHRMKVNKDIYIYIPTPSHSWNKKRMGRETNPLQQYVLSMACMYFSHIHVHIIAYCTIDKCACWFGHTCVQCVACKMQLIWMGTIYVIDVIDIRHSNWNCTFKHLLACHPFSYSQEARNLCHPHISHRAISVPSPTVCQSCACFGYQSKAKRLPYTVISFVSRCMHAKTSFQVDNIWKALKNVLLSTFMANS